ncbi:hypothetical protein [Enterococcus sp. AZ080]|uniref:hypothetical protein n=1 Tax=Enterococcus sp. AZ080 TaxID=2774793 RepID=UPI003F252808
MVKHVKDDFLARYAEYFEPLNFDQFVTAVAKKQNAPQSSKKTVIKAFQTDPLLFTKFKLTDAQLLATIIRDFANQNRFYNQPCVKRKTKAEEMGDGKLFTVLAMMQTVNFFVLEQTKDLEKKQELSEMTPTRSTQIRDEVANFARIMRGGEDKNEFHDNPRVKREIKEEGLGDSKLFSGATTMQTGVFLVIEQAKRLEKKQAVPKCRQKYLLKQEMER